MIKSKLIPLIGAIAFACTFNLAERVIYEVVPMPFWVNYNKIEKRGDYIIGSDLIFYSYADYKRPVNVGYNDVLKCLCQEVSDDCMVGEYFTYSIYPSAGKAYYPQKPVQPWTYQGRTPSNPTNCYLRSTITLELPQGVIKQQVITSNKFNVIREATPSSNTTK